MQFLDIVVEKSPCFGKGSLFLIYIFVCTIILSQQQCLKTAWFYTYTLESNSLYVSQFVKYDLLILVVVLFCIIFIVCIVYNQ